MFSHGTYSVSSFFLTKHPAPLCARKNIHIARDPTNDVSFDLVYTRKMFQWLNWLKHWAAKNIWAWKKNPGIKLCCSGDIVAICQYAHYCSFHSPVKRPSMNIHTTKPWLHKKSNKKVAKSKLIRKNRINQTYKFNKNCFTQFNAVNTLYFPKQWEWQPFWCILARHPNTYGTQMWRQKPQSVNLLRLSNRKIGY